MANKCLGLYVVAATKAQRPMESARQRAMRAQRSLRRTDRATSDDHSCRSCNLRLVHLSECIVRGKVARREDVGHQDQSLVLDSFGCLDDRGVCEWDPDILRLGTVERSGPKQLAFLAARREAIATVEAFATVNGVRET